IATKETTRCCKVADRRPICLVNDERILVELGQDMPTRLRPADKLCQIGFEYQVLHFLFLCVPQLTQKDGRPWRVHVGEQAAMQTLALLGKDSYVGSSYPR